MATTLPGLELPASVGHPARFSRQHLKAFTAVLEQEAASVGHELKVLDSFAGTGTVHRLARPGIAWTAGVELEQEWAAQDPRTLRGDATMLPFRACTFDALITSPAYGNRLSEHHQARDGSRRYGYQRSLGRPLSLGNGAAIAWGDTYRALHTRAWLEAFRVLRPGALALVNVKDFPCDGQPVPVVLWHRGALVDAGFVIESLTELKSPGLPGEDHANARQYRETIIRARKPNR
jgi:hypothetical protein